MRRPRSTAGAAFAAGLLLVTGGPGATAATASPASGLGSTPSVVTFNRDVAPIVFAQCSVCHRPGASGPFPLLTFADVHRRARQISEVTASRLMPPWLPEDGHEPLQDARRLTSLQIQTLRQWYEQGAVEGAAADLPPPPRWTDGWHLGPPDLVLEFPEGFPLPADGRDVYRNLVVRIPTRERRYVRAYEFRPGSRAVHHAFLRLDASGESRRRDEQDPGPGFGGMDVPPSAESPSGHFLSWQPGRLPSRLPDGLAWTLPANADLVLLMHLQPLGKPELVRPSVGLYFTDVPPTNLPTKIGLRSYAIDLPAGASNQVFEEHLTLPVDTHVLAVLPHAHYLARRMEAYARLPDGTRKTLLHIPEWDFNWQSDFRFVQPVALPRGTTVGFAYAYDNSTNNVRNPHHPPRRVTFGLQTTDEMGELWLQVLADRPADRDALERVAVVRNLTALGELSQFRLRQNPADAEAMAELAKVRLSFGNLTNATDLLHQAIRLRPNLADAHYHLGLILLQQQQFAAAEQAFLTAIQHQPDHYQARANAGLCCLRQRRLDEAAVHFQEVLRLHPGDSVAQANLELIARARRQGPASRQPR